MFKKQLYFTVLLLLITRVIFSQSSAPILEWARGNHGYYNVECTAITTDDSGNVYVTGQFKSNPDFDPSSTGYAFLTSYGDYDVFIQKLDPQGNLIWAKSIGGTGVDKASAITVDDSGNVYITGTYNDTVDFNPNTGVANMVSNATNWSGFVLKLDASGSYEWAYGMNGTNYMYVEAIVLDSLNNIVVTGFFNGTTDFDSGGGLLNITSTGIYETFILKLTVLGNLTWVKSIGGVTGTLAASIQIDDYNNIVLVGYFGDSVDFDPGISVFTRTSAGSGDCFVLKLSNSGQFLWAKSFGGTNYDRIENFVIDNNENLILTGIFNVTADFDPDTSVYNLTSNGGQDHFVVSLNSTGSFNWARSAGGTQHDFSNGVDIDNDNNVYMVGHFTGVVDFDPGAGVYNLTSTSTYGDMFLQKLDSTGSFVWARVFNGSGCSGVNIDTTKNIHITGVINNTVDFDPDTSVTTNLTSLGSQDGFIVKFSQCHATTAVLSATICSSYTSPSGNHTWFTAGVYHDTLTNALGCDSILTINVSSNNTYHTLSPSVCSVYVSPSGTYSWTNTGTYYDTLTNSIGCDSILTINLAVNNNDTIFSTLSCGAYTSPSGNYTWTTVGVYQDTLTNSLGCDSALTINLTINNSTTGTQTAVSCTNYTWVINSITYTNSGTYVDTIPNQVGCDSIITLNLTINNITSGTDVVTACFNHTWIDGITYTVSNNSATYVIPNSVGCDSTVTLNLTINEVDTAVIRQDLTLTAQSSSAAYQWIDCTTSNAIANETSALFTITQSGSYAVEITQNGCVDTSSCFVFTGVGINTLALTGISVYPNPTEDILKIDKGTHQNLEITLTDNTGKIVYQVTTKNQITTINMSQLASGVYFVKLENENGVKLAQVVKR